MNRVISWKAVQGSGFASSQKAFSEEEASARLYKSFQISLVPALLQTPEYAEWIIANIEPDLSPSRHLPNAVASRIRRQAIMENPNKVFQFVLYEPALSMKLPGNVMEGQIAHIKELTKRENVDVGVVTLDNPNHVAPVNTFIIHDDKFVSGVTVSGIMQICEEDDVNMYVKHFEHLKSSALWDEDLDKFLDKLASR